ncbi:hypothetical protein GOARA_016_00020 [Gordonia araii NBRC 100433]|uniref:Uncharacterized protein n=1 Tax=Gordonia araii NBRC 100433 TaxID=1073574 RepID=G7GYM3_9ACTN|nr:hypothetical protein [Gordonia araii]NNG99233.1 hypothetical protein [Gordonia araii NBRC 100433]GAB08698.1 hypothetical protein GOARA_016_00020 [Gordonia araii NBRC 100433]
MRTPYAVLRMLTKYRGEIQDAMPGTEIVDAATEVYDELIWRTRMITDHLAEGAPVTRSNIDDMVGAMEALQPIVATVGQLADLLAEAGEALQPRHSALMSYIERVEGDGYTISDDWETVTDVRTPLSGDDVDTAARVQIEAERIARGEQASIYQRRLLRMATGIGDVDAEYAGRIRDLIKPLPDIVAPGG